MLYFKMNGDKCEGISDQYKGDLTWICRSGAEMREQAACEKIAQAATAYSGRQHIAIDNGPHVSPRFDVVAVPVIGDDVSYSFNGDTYPDGAIASISKSLKLITTTTGSKFYRVRNTGSWKKDGTWFLVRGHHYEQNPSF